MNTGAGGLGAVSIGLSEGLALLVVVLLVAFAVFKLAKLLWASLHS